MSSLSVSNLPDCCVMILSCETVKCPVNLQQIPDKCWHMISSSSRPSRQIATSWEQRFLTDGFYLWAEHQSSECLEPAIRLSSIISMRRGSEIVFWLKCRICPVGMALSVLSLVTERIAGPGPDHSTHEDWSELGLTRTQITRYLQIFSLLQSCPLLAPTLLIWQLSNWFKETVIRGKGDPIKTLKLYFIFLVFSDHSRWSPVGRDPGDNLVLWFIYINVLNRSKSVTWPSL